MQALKGLWSIWQPAVEEEEEEDSVKSLASVVFFFFPLSPPTPERPRLVDILGAEPSVSPSPRSMGGIIDSAGRSVGVRVSV